MTKCYVQKQTHLTQYEARKTTRRTKHLAYTSLLLFIYKIDYS